MKQMTTPAEGSNTLLCMPLLMRRPLILAAGTQCAADGQHSCARCLQAASLHGWRWAPSSILATTGSCVSLHLLELQVTCCAPMASSMFLAAAMCLTRTPLQL